MPSNRTTLTDDQIVDLRNQYTRDEWIPPEGAQPWSALSRYNKAEKRDYFTNDDIRKIDDRVWATYGLELEAVWDNAHTAWMAYGGLDDADADTWADKAFEDARYRLIRSECWTVMMSDPMYRASLMVGNDSGSLNALMGAWQSQIEEDRSVALPSNVGGVVSIPLARR